MSQPGVTQMTQKNTRTPVATGSVRRALGLGVGRRVGICRCVLLRRRSLRHTIHHEGARRVRPRVHLAAIGREDARLERVVSSWQQVGRVIAVLNDETAFAESDWLSSVDWATFCPLLSYTSKSTRTVIVRAGHILVRRNLFTGRDVRGRDPVGLELNARIGGGGKSLRHGTRVGGEGLGRGQIDLRLSAVWS